jgi:hypothetical protein
MLTLVFCFALTSSALAQSKLPTMNLVGSAAVANQNGIAIRTCPLGPQAGRVVVPFPEDLVLTTTRQSENSFGPLTVNVPAGIYRITLVSYDDHAEQPPEEDQKQEAWFLQAQSVEGDVAFESNPISDLPRDRNLLVERVEQRVRIIQDITRLSARHILDVGGSETAEGVGPVCAGFDRVINDNFVDAKVISNLPFTDSFNTARASAAPNDPDCVGQGPTVWYAFTPEEDLRIRANTFGSNYDTTLSVYTGQRSNLSQIACNDDSLDLQSRVQFAALAGETYYFMIGASGSGPGGQLTFSVRIAPPPPSNDNLADAIVISDLPFSDSIDAGGATTGPSDPDCTGGATVWYTFSPEEDMNIAADTQGSDYDTTLSVYTGSQSNRI